MSRMRSTVILTICSLWTLTPFLAIRPPFFSYAVDSVPTRERHIFYWVSFSTFLARKVKSLSTSTSP